MKHNNYKVEMIDDINSLIGILSTLRAVEVSSINTSHWTNQYIDSLSEIRNSSFSDEDECVSCKGDGAFYPSYAESIYDAKPCSECQGYGFCNTLEKTAKLYQNINEVSQNQGASSINLRIAELLNKPMYNL